MRGRGKIAALILAAGNSFRMGCLKPLLPLRGSSMIEETIDRFRRGGIDDVRVVLGFEAERIAPLLDRLQVRKVLNPDYKAGMLSSILAGVKDLESDIQAVFVLPSDVPLVKPETIRFLVRTRRETGATVIYPRFLGQRGHPPLLSTGCVSSLPVAFDGGLRAYLLRYEDQSLDVEVVDQAVTMDCDTPLDYRLLQDYGAREDIPTHEECEALWNRFRVSPEVRSHSRLVADLARRFAVHLSRAGFDLDIPLIVAAGCLHDLLKGQRNHAREGAKVLLELGYLRVAPIVASHMDIELKSRALDESALVYLADKYVEGDRIVGMEERFKKVFARFADRPSILESVSRRLKDAKTIKGWIETALGMPLEKMIEDHAIPTP